MSWGGGGLLFDFLLDLLLGPPSGAVAGGGQRQVVAVGPLGEHLEHLPRDSPLALDRLIGVGVRAERDRAAVVAGRGELLAQQRRRVVLGEDPRLEVESAGVAEVLVERPREAVGAAVLTAAVGVEAPGVRLECGDCPAGQECNPDSNTCVPCTLVRTNADASITERSTWLSAAKCTTTSGRCVAKTSSI